MRHVKLTEFDDPSVNIGTLNEIGPIWVDLVGSILRRVEVGVGGRERTEINLLTSHKRFNPLDTSEPTNLVYVKETPEEILGIL